MFYAGVHDSKSKLSKQTFIILSFLDITIYYYKKQTNIRNDKAWIWKLRNRLVKSLIKGQIMYQAKINFPKTLRYLAKYQTTSHEKREETCTVATKLLHCFQIKRKKRHRDGQTVVYLCYLIPRTFFLRGHEMNSNVCQLKAVIYGNVKEHSSGGIAPNTQASHAFQPRAGDLCGNVAATSGFKWKAISCTEKTGRVQQLTERDTLITENQHVRTWIIKYRLDFKPK